MGIWKRDNKKRSPSLRPPPHLPAPNARSSECAAYSNVLVVVDVVEVNAIMGAGMDSLVVDVVDMNFILGAGMHSPVSCFAVKKVILQLRKYLYGCYDLGCARNMKMLRANRGGGVAIISMNAEKIILHVTIHRHSSTA